MEVISGGDQGKDSSSSKKKMPNSMNFNPISSQAQQISQDLPVKQLPLAPIVSTPLDRRGNFATVPIRRGSSIFSPAQTLDHHRNPQPQPTTPKECSSDPDPAQAQLVSLQSQARLANSQSEKLVSLTAPDDAALNQRVRYRECLKNHAANIGAHVVDGCGEFMPSGEEGTPEALRCAACDCHRNFHRKETDGERSNQDNGRRAYVHNLQPQPQPQRNRLIGGPTPPKMMAFGGGAPAESTSEDLNLFGSGGGHAVLQPSPKKRFRTKFNQEQKDKMHEFAVRLGWRIQKHDEHQVQEFCDEVGVKRQIFKVWMHNQKQAMKKRQT